MRRLKNKRAVTYRRREKTEHRAAGNAANVGFFSEIKRIAASLLRDSREGKNYSRKENHTFSQRTLVCKNFCFCRKGEPRNFNNMCAPKYCAARKTPIAPSKARAMGLSFSLGISQASARREMRELNTYSRKENHAFPQRTPICRYLGLRKG